MNYWEIQTDGMNFLLTEKGLLLQQIDWEQLLLNVLKN